MNEVDKRWEEKCGNENRKKGKKNGEDGEIVVLCIEVNVRLKGNDDERVPFFNRSCKFGCLPLWFRAN